MLLPNIYFLKNARLLLLNVKCCALDLTPPVILSLGGLKAVIDNLQPKQRCVSSCVKWAYY